MSDIYSHEDLDGDGFYLRSRGDELKFRAYGTDHSILTRDDVTRLRDSLTAWLGENELTRITEADVRRIVQEELASRVDVPERIVLGVSVDPEPQEVGHAEDPWGVACARCVHKAGVHRGNGGCHAVLLGGEYCECDLDEAGASARVVSAPECTCGHGRDAHTLSGEGACGAWEGGAPIGCTCPRFAQ